MTEIQTMAPAAELTREAQRCGELILKCLSDLGHVWQCKDGSLVEVRFSAAELVGPFAVFEVDVLRLPRKVRANDLTSSMLVHHLATVVGRPVRCVNSTGISYVVNLAPAAPPARAPARLPTRVPLDLDAAPVGALMAPLGVTGDGALWRPLPALGHTLVAGATGSGKSTLLHAALAAVLSKTSPGELGLALVDPKRSEFAVWGQAPHLVGPVAHDEESATALVMQLVAQMEDRGELLARMLARDVVGYNRRAREPLPMIWVVVDEILDLLLTAGEKSELARGLTKLAVRGRSAGILLWVASQHARFDLLPRAVNVNLQSRLVFRVADEAAARLAGCPGAQAIAQGRPGRYLARVDGKVQPVQGFYVPDEQMLAIARGLVGAPAASGGELTEAERALVVYAVERLDGRFISNQLAEAFDGRWTGYQVKQLAQKWERLGLLTRPRHATDARRVGERLLRMAGVEAPAAAGSGGPQGSQAC